MVNDLRPMNFEVFPLEPLPDISEFNNLINIWNMTRGNDLLPVWRNFLFDDLLPWIGHLAISEFDGEEMHALLFGGAFVKLFGREMTGKPFFATLSPVEHKIYHEHFMKVIEGP